MLVGVGIFGPFRSFWVLSVGVVNRESRTKRDRTHKEGSFREEDIILRLNLRNSRKILLKFSMLDRCSPFQNPIVKIQKLTVNN